MWRVVLSVKMSQPNLLSGYESGSINLSVQYVVWRVLVKLADILQQYFRYSRKYFLQNIANICGQGGPRMET